MTNADGGELLLPYIESSGMQPDYVLLLSTEQLIDSSFSFNVEETVFGTSQVMEIRTNGDLQHVTAISFTISGATDELTDRDAKLLELLNGMEIIGNENLAYGRGAEFDKWIDMTSVINGGDGISSGIVPLQAFVEDSELAQLLFTQASGDFDPRDVEDIEESAGVSPLIEFQQIPSLPDRIVYVHDLSYGQDLEFGDGEVEQSTRIVFRIDPDTGLVTQANKHSETMITGSVFDTATSSNEEVSLEYGPQLIELPQPGDPSIETDADKIAAFLELFE